MKRDYPCPVFELGDCEERLSALTCVREGTTGAASVFLCEAGEKHSITYKLEF